MSYFYAVCTNKNQPHFGEAAREHQNALNNYRVYGVASTLDTELFGVNKTPLPKPKETKEMSSVQTVNNMVIYTTTMLCCEDD